MATRIGSVFVAVEADTSLFRTEAIAGVTKAMAGIEAKVPVTADTARARTQIAALKARMTDLNKQLAEVRIGANGKPAEATIRKLQLQLKGLAETVASITLGANTAKLDAAIAKEEANLEVLRAKASDLVLDADEKKLATKIAAAEASLAKLNEEASDLVIDADNKKILSKIADAELHANRLRVALGDPDAIRGRLETAQMEAKLASLDADALVLIEHLHNMDMNGQDVLLLRKIYQAEAELKVLRSLGDVPLIANAVQLNGVIAASEANLVRLKEQAADLRIGGPADLAKLAAVELGVLGVEEGLKKLNPELAATSQALVLGARGFGRWGLGLLGAKVALFGGLTLLSGWHIALDVIVESLAVIIPALLTGTAALVAFGLAGYDAGRAVALRLQNIHTVADATGKVIPPMTNNLEKLHAVVRPQVWQLYGDAITVAGTHQGIFNKLAVDTGGVLDRFAAKITILIRGGGPALTNFLASGARDLEQFGRIVKNLGDAFGKLIEVSQRTHIAEALLAIVNAGAKLFDLFTKLPLPLLTAIIAFHGIYLWSGLAATGIIALLRPLSALAATAAGTKLAGTAVQDLAAVGGGGRIKTLGATFRDLGTNLRAIPSRVATVVKAFGGLVARNPWVVVGVVAVAAVTALAVALIHFHDTTGDALKAIDALGAHATIFTRINLTGAQLTKTAEDLATSQRKFRDAAVAAGTAIQGEGTSLAGTTSVFQRGSTDTDRFTAKHRELVAQLKTETGNLSIIANRYGTQGLAGAMALASLAGVKVNDLFSSNAKTFAVAEQQIAGLVAGYANMGQGSTQLANDINVLTISQSDQLSAVTKLNSAYDQFTTIVSGPTTGFISFANTLKRFSNDAGVAGAKITGLGVGFKTTSKKMTDASLQLQSDFQDTFKAANQMADAMRLTGTASNQQVSAIKNAVQVMIPMAGKSKIAAAEISALAQEAGGPATTNLQTLAKWAGKTKDPLAQLQKAANDAGAGFANMSEDAQKLGTTLATDLTGDMAKAIEAATGLQGALNTYAIDIQKGRTSTQQGRADLKNLNDILVIVTGSQAGATSQVKSMNDMLTRNATTLQRTDQARKNYQDSIQAILDKAPGAAGDIEKMRLKILAQGATADQKKSARQQLIKDLENSGLSAKAATALVDTYIGTLGRVPKNVNTTVSVNAAAAGTIFITGAGWAAGQGNIRFHSGNAARGMYVNQGTTPTADDVPAMLSKGEVVVPTHMVNAGAVDHLRGMLPGFASGGVAGVGSQVTSAPPRAAAITGNMAQRATQAGVTHAMDKVHAQVAAKAAEMRAVGPASGGGHVNWAPGAGVNQWRVTTLKALAQLGLPSGLVLDVLYQMMTESGGNPNIVNKWDSNWLAGHPSVGLMQVIAGTFAANAGPYRNTGPFLYGVSVNPMANIYAALHYGMTNGRGFGMGPGQIGSGHGYATGGLVGGLSTAQRGEQSKYFGLQHSFAIGPKKYLTKLTVQELHTLANRQASEMAAFDALMTGTMLQSELSHLGATARAERIVASDQMLNRTPGGHPGFARDLRSFLSSISSLSSQRIPTGTSGGGGAKPPPPPVATLKGVAAARAGQTYLNAWRSRRGGGYGAAWSPIVVNEQIVRMAAAQRNAQVLATASGLTARQHAHYHAVAIDDAKRLAVLNRELSIERTWRGQLAATDTQLARQIKAAGSSPALAKNVKAWKAQQKAHQYTINQISKMLGYSDATIAAMNKAGKIGPGGAPLPKITHVYGGDVSDTIGSFISSVAPFMAGGLVKSFDRGGWLKPGWTAAYNGTGRSERVGGTGDMNITFEVTPSGSAFDQFLIAWLKKNVKVKGGGNVQRAWGSH